MFPLTRAFDVTSLTGDTMKPSKRVMRQNVLAKMFDYLQTTYSIEYPREVFVKGNLTFTELKALLAYKSDPQLDEYTRALNQIESNTYGTCIGCKGHIPSDALRTDPTRRTCSVCESSINDSIVRSRGMKLSTLATYESNFVML